MTLFAAEFLERLRDSHDARRWPGLLADPERSDVREAIEVALSSRTADVREGVARLLTSTALRDLFVARALLHGLALSDRAGCTAVAITRSNALHLRGPGDRDFTLAPLLFHTGAHHAGKPDDVGRLVAALERVFGRRPFGLHVRRPLAPGFDPEPVARAVQLWLLAVDRGEWDGRHAMYDEDTVSVELTLVRMRERGHGRGMVFFQGPSQTLQRLSLVDSHLQQLVRQHRKDEGERPLVALMAADPSWSFTRGYQCQLLYGTADESHSSRVDGGTEDFRARYAERRFSLFADELFSHLGALWWVEPGANPLALRAWAHENPWSEVGTRVAAFPGRRFERAISGESGVVMTWRDADRTTWSLA